MSSVPVSPRPRRRLITIGLLAVSAISTAEVITDLSLQLQVAGVAIALATSVLAFDLIPMRPWHLPIRSTLCCASAIASIIAFGLLVFS